MSAFKRALRQYLVSYIFNQTEKLTPVRVTNSGKLFTHVCILPNVVRRRWRLVAQPGGLTLGFVPHLVFP